MTNMPEAEWLACTDPAVMWEDLWYPHVNDHVRTRIWDAAEDGQERLTRLCRSAFARHDARLKDDPAVLRSILLCEAEADHGRDEEAVAEAEADLDPPEIPESAGGVAWYRYTTARGLIEEFDGIYWQLVCGELNWLAPDAAGRRVQADLLRDIFGNPMRRVRVEPAWLAWSGGAIVQLARAIYEERAFHGMPLLGDLLQDAGCTAATVLEHCRAPVTHVRGCWVLDGLLGKAARVP